MREADRKREGQVGVAKGHVLLLSLEQIRPICTDAHTPGFDCKQTAPVGCHDVEPLMPAAVAGGDLNDLQLWCSTTKCKFNKKKCKKKKKKLEDCRGKGCGSGGKRRSEMLFVQ